MKRFSEWGFRGLSLTLWNGVKNWVHSLHLDNATIFPGTEVSENSPQGHIVLWSEKKHKTKHYPSDSTGLDYIKCWSLI